MCMSGEGMSALTIEKVREKLPPKVAEEAENGLEKMIEFFGKKVRSCTLKFRLGLSRPFRWH